MSPVEEHPAVVGDVLRQQDLRGAEPGRDQEPAEQVADPDAARSGVLGVHVGLALRIVELPLPRPHEHVLVGQLAVVDLRPGDPERHGRHRRQVLHEQHGQAFAGDLVDGAERESHAVGERQVLVDEGPGRERRRVELARREQDLPVLPVDPVPVVVHADEVVVGADLLQLSEGQEQGVPVPQPHVLDGRRVGPDVGQREIRLAVELAGLHAVDPPGLAGGEDVVPEIGRLASQLGRRHEELLHRRREEAAAEDGHDHVASDRQHPVQAELPPQAPDQHGDRHHHREYRRHPERGQLGVQVRVAGADQRPGGGIEQIGDLHHPQPQGGEDEQHGQQNGQVQARGRLDAQAPRAQHHVAAHPVERDQQEQAEAGERGEEPDRRRERGQREDVEPDVAREDRVRDPERGAVDGAEDDLPGRRGGQAGQQAQHDRHRQAQAPQGRRQVQVRRRRRDPEHDRVGDQPPLSGPQVQVEHAGRQPARRQEQQHPGGQLTGEDGLVPDLTEPPPVGDEGVGGRQDEHHQEEGEQQDAASGGIGTRWLPGSRLSQHRPRGGEVKGAGLSGAGARRCPPRSVQSDE